MDFRISPNRAPFPFFLVSEALSIHWAESTAENRSFTCMRNPAGSRTYTLKLRRRGNVLLRNIGVRLPVVSQSEKKNTSVKN
jgi:hypothetical protein